MLIYEYFGRFGVLESSSDAVKEDG